MPGIDAWFDEKTLLDIAAPDVFVRGASAAEHGSVEILEHDESHLRARRGYRDIRGGVLAE